MKRRAVFGRVLSKRGSVLFVVLVMMSVMIIVASAVYYTVSSDRAQVVMTYSDEQAYETAINVLDLLENSLLYKSVSGSDYEALYNKISGLTPTSAPLTAELKAESLNMPSGIGETVKVTIYAVASVDNPGKNDIIVKASVDYNGKVVTATRVFGLDKTPPEFPGFTKLFATTGNNPADTVFVTPGVTSDVHFGSQSGETVLGKKSSEAQYFGNVSVDGNLYVGIAQFLSFDSEGAKDLDVSGSILFPNIDTNPLASSVGLQSGGETRLDNGGNIRIGGNFDWSDTSREIKFGTKPLKIYVMGDFTYEGKVHLSRLMSNSMSTGILKAVIGEKEAQNYTLTEQQHHPVYRMVGGTGLTARKPLRRSLKRLLIKRLHPNIPNGTQNRLHVKRN